MKSPNPHDAHDIQFRLYQQGLSLTVLFDLLVSKGILTKDEIRRHAQTLKQELITTDSDITPE